MPPTFSPKGRRPARVGVAIVLMTGLIAGSRVTLPAQAIGDPVLLAAGDVGSCSTLLHGDEETAKLLQRHPAAPVAMLGDGAYDMSRPGSGADLQAYEDCYGPSWGQPDIKSRTRPATGNHEYVDPDGTNPGAAGYFDYFEGPGMNDGSAGPRPLGYYSYEVGAWHIVVLNAHCASNKGLRTPLDGCGPDSTMGKWLKADLAAHPGVCTLAYWHEPRFFSYSATGQAPPAGNTSPDSDPTMDAMWRILQDHGSDIVLNGHRHVYERFPKVIAPPGTTGPGIPDANGIREFVVGTGGGPREHFVRDTSGKLVNMDPNSDTAAGGARIEKTFGVLRLTLHQNSYDWQYVTAGSSSSDPPADAGSDTCNSGSRSGPTTSSSTTTTISPTPGAPADDAMPVPPASARHRPGYWMVGSDGHVYGFGGADGMGDGVPAPKAEAVDLEPTPTGKGYWVVDSGGSVAARGDAPSLGGISRGALRTGERVTSLSRTPSGHGYWIFTSLGRVFALGDANSHGDLSNVALNGPVLDSSPTPSGNGYYMVASDGGIFAFGDARFAGSMGGRHLNAPVQSLVPDPDGTGYWLVASDGGVFAFGAPFRGSMGDTPLNKPITGMVPYGNGYLMVAEDGGVFDFSDVTFVGSLGATPPARPIVAVAAVL